MERRRLPFLLVFVSTAIAGVAASITRDDFPAEFIFGAGTSAYQVEGAAAEDGRKPSIWDTYAHSGRTKDKKTADITADQYHHYKEDVKLMKKMCLDAYRFSISWSRLIPDGRGRINPKGLQYYNNLINELIINGIEPHVTLHHFDHPQALEDEYGGLVSPKMIEDFTAYADFCFKEFGDRVKYWSTFNEPNVEAILGYDVALFPPGRCSSPFGRNCSAGDSRTEPYISGIPCKIGIWDWKSSIPRKSHLLRKSRSALETSSRAENDCWRAGTGDFASRKRKKRLQRAGIGFWANT